MANASAFADAEHYRPAATVEVGDVLLPERFDALAGEYATARRGAVLLDRSDRALIVLTAADRKGWLHNLVTNAVKTLDDGAGNYAFALDVKGRVQFDLNVLCLPDALWLDVDRAAADAALSHLNRYLITEDVKIEDRTAAYARLAWTGPQAAALAAGLGAGNAQAMAALSTFALDRGAAHLVRHDFCGLPGFEFIVPRAQAATWWDRLVTTGARPAGFRTLDVLRIEAGIPWLGRDIDGTVLPPETGQIERGISYQKGCYLGQEVVERMRSHGALARRLVRLEMDPGPPPTLPAELRRDGSVVGRITSLVNHPVQKKRPGLGYLKTAVTEFSGLVAGDPPQGVAILE